MRSEIEIWLDEVETQVRQGRLKKHDILTADYVVVSSYHHLKLIAYCRRLREALGHYSRIAVHKEGFFAFPLSLSEINHRGLLDGGEIARKVFRIKPEDL